MLKVARMALTLPLQRFIDDTLADSAPWIQTVADQALADLRTGGHAAASALPRTALAEACEALAVRRFDFVQAFERALKFEARHAAIDGGGPGAGLDAPPTAPMDEWGLVDEDQAEEDIELMRVVQLLKNDCEAELRDLQARLSTLRGFTEIRADANPLGADEVAQALWAAVQAVGQASSARLALMRALAPPLVQALRAVYARALRTLAAQGVQAAAYRAVVAPAPAVRGEPPNSGFDVTQPGAFDVLMMENWRRQHADQPHAPFTPGVLGGGGFIRSAQAQAALEAALQAAFATSPSAGAVNLIRAHEPALLAAARDDKDREAIALLGQLFEQILADAWLAPPVRELLARLQGVVLRTALADARLLDAHTHALWQVVNLVGSHTAGYVSDDLAGDPRLGTFCARLAPWVARLAVAGGEDAALQREVQAEVAQIVAAEVAQDAQAAQPVIQRLHFAAAREACLRLYRQRLAIHEARQPLDATLRPFFVGAWPRVLAQAAMQGGEAAAMPYLDTAEALFDSLSQPASAAARQDRLRSVPQVVQRLQAGMDLIGFPQGARQAVLGALMARHAELLREPPSRSAAELMQALRDEPAGGFGDLGFDAPLARGDTVMDVATLDTVPAELLDGPLRAPPAAGTAGAGAWLSRPVLGLWLRLHVRGVWMQARLVWQSEDGEHWVLGGAPAAQPLALTRRALRRLADEGLARPLQERNLLERAVDGLIAGLRG